MATPPLPPGFELIPDPPEGFRRVESFQEWSETAPRKVPINPALQDQAIAEQAFAEQGGMQQFMSGAGANIAETGQGIAEIFGREEDPNQAMREATRSTPYGRAGHLASEIAQIALPAGILTKGLKAAGLARGATALGDVAATTGVAALQPGATMEDVAAEGALSLGGSAVGGVLQKAMRGAKRTPAAQKILDEGGYLTPGQAAQSKGITGFEQLAQYAPFLSRGVRQLREEGLESWGRVQLQRAAPEGVQITQSGTKGVRELRNAYRKGYETAWGTAKPLTHAAVRDTIDFVAPIAERMGKKDTRVLRNVIEDVVKARQSGTAGAIENVDASLRDHIARARIKGKEDLGTALTGVRERLRARLAPEGVELMDRLDRGYPNFLVVRDAASRAAGHAGMFDPRQMVAASRRIGGVARTGVGEAPMQQAALEGVETVGREVTGSPLLGAMQAAARSFPSPPMRGAGNVLIGRNPVQQALRKVDDSALGAARRAAGVRAGVVAPAAGELEAQDPKTYYEDLLRALRNAPTF